MHFGTNEERELAEPGLGMAAECPAQRILGAPWAWVLGSSCL